MPIELPYEATSCLREAADMGNASELKAVAGELKLRSDELRPISEPIIRVAEEFDFESVLTWVKKWKTTKYIDLQTQ